MPVDPQAELAKARDAYARRAWEEAHARLAAADGAGALGPADLWLLALSAYLTGRHDAFLESLERAHHAHLEAEEPIGAVRCAFWLGFWLANEGEMGRAGGWLGRAARLLEGVEEECAERGYLLVPAAYQQLTGGEHERAYETAGRAVAVAQRFGDADLLALGVHLQGRALLMQSRVEEGLALLDESMIAVATDELSPQVTGLIYCSSIGACRSVWELRRAHEWTAALSEWCERQPDLVPYSGECLVYRAEILQLRGAWEDALDEVGRARERIARGSDRSAAAAALYRKGEVHRLRGEFAHAEEAYREANRLGMEPQPGLALLRLAQGDAEAAAAALRRALEESAEGLRRARLLPALVEVALELGELEDADRACGELEELASAARTGVLDTLVAQARGAIELARGDARAALPLLRRAFEGWERLEAPWEAARVRVLRGLACRELGDAEGAALELDAARATFDGLGAAPDAARVDALSGSRRPRDAHGLTPRELEVLAELATGRTNKAIASRLFISEKTVARHVSNIFAKLGLASRAAATAYAYEHDLVDPPG